MNNDLMEGLKKEIELLEYQKENFKKINLKRNIIKNLKITSKVCKVLAPYVLVIGLQTIGFNAIGLKPFTNEDVKSNAYKRVEFDSLGNYGYDIQYENYTYEQNTITYYSNWIYRFDSLYYRDIKIYKSDSIDEREINKYFSSSEGDLDLLFQNKFIEKREYKKFEDFDPTENNEIIKITFTNIDQDDYIIVKGDIQNQIFEIGMYIVAAFVLCNITNVFLKRMKGFDLKKLIKKVKEDYPDLNIEEISKVLEIKKDNYNRLK